VQLTAINMVNINIDSWLFVFLIFLKFDMVNTLIHGYM